MSAYVCVREKEKKMKKRGLERERERDEIFFQTVFPHESQFQIRSNNTESFHTGAVHTVTHCYSPCLGV